MGMSIRTPTILRVLSKTQRVLRFAQDDNPGTLGAVTAEARSQHTTRNLKPGKLETHVHSHNRTRSLCSMPRFSSNFCSAHLKAHPPGAPILKVSFRHASAARSTPGRALSATTPEPEKLELTLAHCPAWSGEGKVGALQPARLSPPGCVPYATVRAYRTKRTGKAGGAGACRTRRGPGSGRLCAPRLHCAMANPRTSCAQNAKKLVVTFYGWLDPGGLRGTGGNKTAGRGMNGISQSRLSLVVELRAPTVPYVFTGWYTIC